MTAYGSGSGSEGDLAPAQPASRRRRMLRALLRAVIGAVVITLLWVRGGGADLLATISSAEAADVTLALALLLVMLLVSGVRWHLFLHALGLNLRLASAIRLFYVGMFFNAFLPTGVGGDAYKAARLRHAGLSRAVASVLLDRIAGIVALALLGLAAVAWLAMEGPVTALVPLTLVLGLAVLAVTGLLIAAGPRLVGSGSGTWFGLRPKLRSLLGAMSSAGRGRSAPLRALALSLVGQGLVIAAHLLIARSLGLRVGASVIAATALVIGVAALAPVTLNGLGIREALWIWLLGLYAVPQQTATAYAFLALAISLGASLVGGIIYVVSNEPRHVSSRQGEDENGPNGRSDPSGGPDRDPPSE